MAAAEARATAEMADAEKGTTEYSTSVAAKTKFSPSSDEARKQQEMFYYLLVSVQYISRLQHKQTHKKERI